MAKSGNESGEIRDHSLLLLTGSSGRAAGLQLMPENLVLRDQLSVLKRCVPQAQAQEFRWFALSFRLKEEARNIHLATFVIVGVLQPLLVNILAKAVKDKCPQMNAATLFTNTNNYTGYLFYAYGTTNRTHPSGGEGSYSGPLQTGAGSPLAIKRSGGLERCCSVNSSKW